MADPYFGFVAAAYGFSALALLALGLFTLLDARAARRALGRIEGASRRTEGRP